MQLIHIAPYLPYRLEAVGIEYSKYEIANKPAKMIEVITLGNFYALAKIGYKPILKPLDRPNDSLDIRLFEEHYDVFGLINKGLAYNYNIIYTWKQN